MLECEACVVKLDCTIDPMLDPEEVGKIASELVKQLTEQHADGCAWREKVCPERFSDGPTGVHAKAGLQERCQALMQSKEKLPRLLFKDATRLKRMLHIAQGVLNRGGGGGGGGSIHHAGSGSGGGAAAAAAAGPCVGAPGNDDSSVVASYVLGLCGWQVQAKAVATHPPGAELAAAGPTSASSTGLVLQCGFCRMRTTVTCTNVVQWPPKQDTSLVEADPAVSSVVVADAAAVAAIEAGSNASASQLAAAPAGDTSPEPVPQLKRQLTPKQQAAASIKPERRFGVPVAGDRQRLKRMLSGSSDTSPSKKKIRAVASDNGMEFDPTNTHRSFCPYLGDGFKALVASTGAVGAKANDVDSAQAALRLVRSL